jgi:hypothetical protein
MSWPTMVSWRWTRSMVVNWTGWSLKPISTSLPALTTAL